MWIFRPRPAVLAVALLAWSASGQETEPKKKVSQVRWVTSYPEAVKRAQERFLPVLVCFNMDDEVANDHAAQEIYRDPDFVELSGRFICVIGSVFTHESVEDSEGESVCSRFGAISCADHKATEGKARRALIGKSENIAPQHIILRPNGEILNRRAYHIPKDELVKSMRRSLRALGLDSGEKEGAGGTPALDPARHRKEIAEMLKKAERGSFSFDKGQTVRAVHDLGTDMARDALIDYLEKGSDDQVRAEITKVLAQSGDFVVQDVLLKATKSRSSLVALAAVDALGTLALPTSASGVKKLMGKFPGGHDHGRVLRAYAACGAPEPAVRKLVLKRAKGRSDKTIQAHAIVALGFFPPDEEITKVLLQALKEEGLFARAAAAYTIGISNNGECKEALEEMTTASARLELQALGKAAGDYLGKNDIEAAEEAVMLRFRLERILPLGDTRRF